MNSKGTEKVLKSILISQDIEHGAAQNIPLTLFSL